MFLFLNGFAYSSLGCRHHPSDGFHIIIYTNRNLHFVSEQIRKTAAAHFFEPFLGFIYASFDFDMENEVFTHSEL